MGDLEFEVLQALWKQSPAPVTDVLAAINGRRRRSQRLAYTTVMTVMARLYDKEILDRTKRGRGYDYTPRFDEGELVDQLGRQEVADLLRRYGPVALAQFAAALEDADPELLARVIDLAEQTDDEA